MHQEVLEALRTQLACLPRRKWLPGAIVLKGEGAVREEGGALKGIRVRASCVVTPSIWAITFRYARGWFDTSQFCLKLPQASRIIAVRGPGAAAGGASWLGGSASRIRNKEGVVGFAGKMQGRRRNKTPGNGEWVR